jgi:F-type H+-transporting ATPase subunit epsilon
MSDKIFKLTLVTPDRTVLDGVDATEVDAFGIDGAFHALPGHEPFLTALPETNPEKGPTEDFGKSTFWYRNPAGERHDYNVDGGFIEVLPHKVTVLAKFACSTEEMSSKEYYEAEKQIQEEITRKLEESKKKADKSEYELLEINEMELQLRKSVIRVQSSQRKRDFGKKS